MSATLRLYLAAAIIVAGGAFLHHTVLRDVPENALVASFLAGIVATATLTMLGHDPF
jgi:hypothetical protein